MKIGRWDEDITKVEGERELSDFLITFAELVVLERRMMRGMLGTVRSLSEELE